MKLLEEITAEKIQHEALPIQALLENSLYYPAWHRWWHSKALFQNYSKFCVLRLYD